MFLKLGKCLSFNIWDQGKIEFGFEAERLEVALRQNACLKILPDTVLERFHQPTKNSKNVETGILKPDQHKFQKEKDMIFVLKFGKCNLVKSTRNKSYIKKVKNDKHSKNNSWNVLKKKEAKP